MSYWVSHITKNDVALFFAVQPLLLEKYGCIDLYC